MGRLSMATRKELTEVAAERYQTSNHAEKTRVLDEFVDITGYHRKHAMRLLRGEARARTGGGRRRRIYDEAERNALVLLWEASDRVCGKRLKALMPVLIEAMERHGHVELAADIRAKLLAMSAATIDRALARVREGLGRRRRRPAAHALRSSIPIRTSADWGDPSPGFVEADLVAHSGPSTRGSFIQTLVLTDIATGWTECAPLIVREQTLLSTVLTELRKQLPFALLGLDTDNDTVLMNETLKAYCDAANIAFRRCRPYRKNDQAFVEQKNGAVVRRMVGYRRFEGLEAATLLAELYRSARLFVNFFQPSFKLIAKRRDGARVRKTYSAPMTPHQRLAADVRTPDEVRARLQEIYAGLDPVVLLRDIRASQERLAALADVQPVGHTAAGGATHRTFPDESAHGVEGRRYSANGPADRQSKEGTSSSGSTRSRNARSTKVVRSRAVADRQRTPVAAADGISRRLPQQAAANASAPSQGVAKRTGERIAVSIGVQN